MPDVAARLMELGITLPEPTKPIASYIPAVTSGSGSPRLVFVSGQIPSIKPGVLVATGTVPDQVSIEKAGEAARQCVINALAVLRGHLGDLNKVRRVVKVDVFVACGAGFGDQPKVANGASDLLVQVFGDAGKHTRAAVGAPSLPLNACVEVAMIVEAE